MTAKSDLEDNENECNVWTVLMALWLTVMKTEHHKELVEAMIL